MEIHRSARQRGALALLAVLGLGFALAAPVGADNYDPKKAGHPLRVAAYVAHPVGVILDMVIMRPFHWVGSHEPFRTLVGHTD